MKIAHFLRFPKLFVSYLSLLNPFFSLGLRWLLVTRHAVGGRSADDLRDVGVSGLCIRRRLLMPGILAHRGVTAEQLVGHLFFTTEGIFGIPLGTSSTFTFLFIHFGAYLEATGWRLRRVLHRPGECGGGLGVGRTRQGGGAVERADGHGVGQLGGERGGHRVIHHTDDEEAWV